MAILARSELAIFLFLNWLVALGSLFFLCTTVRKGLGRLGQRAAHVQAELQHACSTLIPTGGSKNCS